MSQSPADSLSTVEDRTLYDEVYNVKEGVPREEVSKEELADPHGSVRSQASLVTQNGKRVDRLDKKRVRFQDSDSDVDDSHPSVKRKVSRTEENSALLTATEKIQDLEARVEALEKWKVNCVQAIQEWVKMAKIFTQYVTAVMEAQNTGD
ncbi:hypothetical protein K458DRAFT_392328 [Lentithecium fluviatile CBS 122367]|uniref:Uncharacterized protein n=1 Tax=Lentithecium fluviatile CBS 122367 TaxID=1168545 RepID=A0A6G1IT34_9PLEO|nr:hypothetical protein K458DRAFT_392328 [Lentithecium fluviatile CBS 122367]